MNSFFAPVNVREGMRKKQFVAEVKQHLNEIEPEDIRNVEIVLWVVNLAEWSFGACSGSLKKQCVISALKDYYDEDMLSQLIELYCSNDLVHGKTILRRLKYLILGCILSQKTTEEENISQTANTSTNNNSNGSTDISLN